MNIISANIYDILIFNLQLTNFCYNFCNSKLYVWFDLWGLINRIIDGINNEVVFIPETFFSKHPKFPTFSAVTEHLFPTSKMKKDHFVSDLKGEAAENNVFLQIREFFANDFATANKLGKIVVFWGLKHKLQRGEKEEKELDFLILFRKFRLIVSIECKSSRKRASDAVKQLYENHQMLQSLLNIEEKGWNLARIFFCPNITDDTA